MTNNKDVNESFSSFRNTEKYLKTLSFLPNSWVTAFFKFVRAYIWPLNSSENAKFAPMSFMLLLTIFIYCILRGTKDTILITSMGADMIFAVKLYGTTPFAIIFMVLYTKLANIVRREMLYYLLVSVFLGYFVIFGFVLYPYREFFQHDFSSMIVEYPHFKHILKMLSNPMVSLFYIMAELWGSVMLSLMFWQFANMITPIHQARRFYSLFGLIGQSGMVFAGGIMIIFAEMRSSMNLGADGWRMTLSWLMASVAIAGVLLAGLHRYMYKKILTKKIYYDPEEMDAGKKSKSKIKMSVWSSIKYMASSKYIGLIAMLVICYGTSMTLVEVVWKNQLKILYPDPSSYNEFMGYFQVIQGFCTIIGMLIGANILRRFSWKVSALITPIMILITGGLFFMFILYQNIFGAYIAMMGTNVIIVAVMTGSLQNIFSKSVKYSLFDATKEMSYIPLDNELKVKGKAAVDVVGARLGKSGGAVIQQILIWTVVGASTASNTLSYITEQISYIFLVVMVIWIFSIFALSKRFEKEVKKHDKAFAKLEEAKNKRGIGVKKAKA